MGFSMRSRYQPEQQRSEWWSLFTRRVLILCLQLTVIFGALSATSSQSSAQTHNDYVSDNAYPKKPKRPSRGGPNWGGIAVGVAVGAAIINEISKKKKPKEPQVHQSVPPKKVVKKPRKTPKRTVKKTYRKSPKNYRKTPPPPRYIALPDTIRMPRAKPRAYAIGDKPWASEREFVVVLKSGLTQSAVQDFLQHYGLEKIAQTRIGLLDQVILKLAYPEDMSPARALELASDHRVFRAQPNYFYYPANDKHSSRQGEIEQDEGALQYALAKLGLNRLDGKILGKGVPLAIIDSGVSAEHPALAGRIRAHFSAFRPEERDRLNHDHGTAIASIIAAKGGMKGIASEVNLMSAQVFGYSEAGHIAASSYDLVRGIDWAVANGARILNLSFAGRKDDMLQEALRKAAERGVIAVAAAGNEGPDAPAAFPAAYDSVIAVTATDFDDGLYSFANRGAHVELCAPGVDVFVATGSEGFGLQSGTSMAAAYISGAIALLLEQEPELSIADIKARLVRSVVDLGQQGRDPQFGHGLVDVHKALETTKLATSQVGAN